MSKSTRLTSAQGTLYALKRYPPSNGSGASYEMQVEQVDDHRTRPGREVCKPGRYDISRARFRELKEQFEEYRNGYDTYSGHTVWTYDIMAQVRDGVTVFADVDDGPNPEWPASPQEWPEAGAPAVSLEPTPFERAYAEHLEYMDAVVRILANGGRS